MRDVQRFQGEAGISQANSKRYDRIQDTLEELAGMLVSEMWDTEMDSDPSFSGPHRGHLGRDRATDARLGGRGRRSPGHPPGRSGGMTAEATLLSIPEAVQRAVDDLPIDPGQWLYDVVGEVFERYACNDEKCPNRPAWDIARKKMFDETATSLDNAINEVLTNRITRALVAYAGEYPDAPRASSTKPLVSASA